MPAFTAEYWELKNRVVALMDRTGCWDNTEFVIRNLQAGVPAFWGTYGGSNAAAGTFMASANFFEGIEAGKADIRAHFARNNHDVDAEEWLDSLIPLNRAAVSDLMLAYQSVGTWRTKEELANRAFRDGWARFRLGSGMVAATAAEEAKEAAK